MNHQSGMGLFVLILINLQLSYCNSYYLNDKLTSPGSNTGSGNKSGNPVNPSAIYMFKAVATYAGDLATAGGTPGNGRQGADNLCISTRPSFTFTDNSCINVRAFVSISAGDSIANMPANYGISTAKPIKAPNDSLVDSDWPNLLSQPIAAASLFGVGILPASINWWSFSANTADGTFDGTANCSGGASTAGNGAQGNSGVNNTAWMNNGNAVCSTAQYVLCVCY